MVKSTQATATSTPVCSELTCALLWKYSVALARAPQGSAKPASAQSVSAWPRRSFSASRAPAACCCPSCSTRTSGRSLSCTSHRQGRRQNGPRPANSSTLLTHASHPRSKTSGAFAPARGRHILFLSRTTPADRDLVRRRHYLHKMVQVLSGATPANQDPNSEAFQWLFGCFRSK